MEESEDSEVPCAPLREWGNGGKAGGPAEAQNQDKRGCSVQGVCKQRPGAQVIDLEVTACTVSTVSSPERGVWAALLRTALFMPRDVLRKNRIREEKTLQKTKHFLRRD